MILVVGATGTVGSEVVRQLAAGGHQVRAFVRADVKAARTLGAGVELARGDVSRPETLDTALRGVERMYLLSPMAPNMRELDAVAIDVARRAGVHHVVKHSNMGAASEPGTTLQRWHREGEKLLEDSGLAWTFVRPTGFMSNALGWARMIKGQGAVYAPGGDGKLSVVDPRDIAAVAVAALTEPGHEGKAYEVTGPEALSTAEQVAVIAEVTGKSIDHVDIPAAAAREHMRGAGMPAVVVDALLEFTDLVRTGDAAMVTGEVRAVTGRSARTFEGWVLDNAAAFK